MASEIFRHPQRPLVRFRSALGRRRRGCSKCRKTEPAWHPLSAQRQRSCRAFKRLQPFAARGSMQVLASGGTGTLGPRSPAAALGSGANAGALLVRSPRQWLRFFWQEWGLAGAQPRRPLPRACQPRLRLEGARRGHPTARTAARRVKPTTNSIIHDRLERQSSILIKRLPGGAVKRFCNNLVVVAGNAEKHRSVPADGDQILATEHLFDRGQILTTRSCGVWAFMQGVIGQFRHACSRSNRRSGERHAQRRSLNMNTQDVEPVFAVASSTTPPRSVQPLPWSGRRAAGTPVKSNQVSVRSTAARRGAGCFGYPGPVLSG